MEPPEPAKRRPRRRGDHRLVAGVAGGLADYTGARPILFRLGFVLFTVVGGLGVLIYLLLWCLIPREDLPDSAAQRLARRFPNAPSWAGVGLLMVGAVFLAGEFGLWRPNVVWAFLLIGLGVALFKRDAERAVPTAVPGGSVGLEEPGAAVGFPRAPAEPSPPPGTEAPPAPPAPPATRPKRPRSLLGPLTLGAMLLALGGAAVLDGLGALRLSAAQYLALPLVVIGAGLLAGALFGRARWLILPGLLLLPLLVVASLIDVPLEGGVGDRYAQPRSLQEVETPYRLVEGTLFLDLTRLRLGDGPVEIEASVGAGGIQVQVSEGTRVEVRAQAGGGELQIGSHAESGLGLSDARAFGPQEGSLLRLDLAVGLGDVRVYSVPVKHRAHGSRDHNKNKKGAGGGR